MTTKAKVKATGEIVEVECKFGGIYSANNGKRYWGVDLDFNISTPEKAVIEGYVARDRNGDLSLYRTYPERQENFGYWRDGDGESKLPQESFPSITWESEPQRVKIEITLIDEKGE